MSHAQRTIVALCCRVSDRTFQLRGGPLSNSVGKVSGLDDKSRTTDPVCQKREGNDLRFEVGYKDDRGHHWNPLPLHSSTPLPAPLSYYTAGEVYVYGRHSM